MNLQHINIQELVSNVKKELKSDETLSPSMKVQIELLLALVSFQFEKLNKNSKNSSIPPSQDINRLKKEKLDSKRKPGGQPGHIGSTLERVTDPDKIVPLQINRRILPKGRRYTNTDPEKRQVKDFEVNVIVTEYQAEVLIDEFGNRFVAEFPCHVTKAIQYGPAVKAHAIDLNTFQFCAVDRIVTNFSDQLDINISAGSINNFQVEAYNNLEPFEAMLKNVIPNLKTCHADETGVNVGGKRIWMHTVCNNRFTHFQVHEKRGNEATDEIGILQNFTGTLIHDHWKPYFKYENCTHALCGSHHLRELTAVEETDGFVWAKVMREFLLELNDEVGANGGVLKIPRQEAVRIKYREILKNGEKECPAPVKIAGKRGKTKRTKARNLLERLSDFENETLAFMTDKDIPFTNNQAENDIRMYKLQQKISGCFRSMEGANFFARIRSYINTCRKHKINISEALKAIFTNDLHNILQKIKNYAE